MIGLTTVVAVRRSRITDPIAFTLALQARIEMGNTDRIVSRAALLRVKPFVASVDPAPLAPEFFRALHKIQYTPAVPS